MPIRRKRRTANKALKLRSGPLRAPRVLKNADPSFLISWLKAKHYCLKTGSQSMSIDEHKYIKLLDYAVSQVGSYHMTPALERANMTEREFELIRDTLFVNANMQAPPPRPNQTYDWRLRPEAVFGYLAYKQYEHAQKSSQRAFYVASGSLIVAFFALVGGCFSG